MILYKKQLVENISDFFTSEVLSENELATILGGKRRKGKSRDKDILDLDDEEENDD